MKVALLDVETTGDDPEQDVPVEFAAIFCDDTKPTSKFTTLIHPGDRPISPVASACHHITKDTYRKESYIGQPNQSYWNSLLGDQQYLVAHNAAFDRSFIPVDGPSWICTWKVARHVYSNAPKYSLQCLRYWLGLGVRPSAKLYPHRALYDTETLLSLYQHFREKHSIKEMEYFTRQPVLLTEVSFGKYRGTLWAEVPRDYLKWVVKQDFDEDTMYTAHYLLTD